MAHHIVTVEASGEYMGDHERGSLRDARAKAKQLRDELPAAHKTASIELHSQDAFREGWMLAAGKWTRMQGGK